MVEPAVQLVLFEFLIELGADFRGFIGRRFNESADVLVGGRLGWLIGCREGVLERALALFHAKYYITAPGAWQVKLTLIFIESILWQE